MPSFAGTIIWRGIWRGKDCRGSGANCTAQASYL